MKRSYRGVLSLCLILFFNIVITQATVHQYYFENYGITLLLAGLNVVLFPIAIWIYKRHKNVEANPNEK